MHYHRNYRTDRYTYLLGLGVCLCLSACNSEELLVSSDGHRPVITLDSEDGIYTVKPGRTFTVAPDFEYCTPEQVVWRGEDGRTVNSGMSWTTSFDELGDMFVTISATNAAGTTTEDILIECVALTPPVISLALPDEGATVTANTDYIFAPDLQHADGEDFAIEWYVNDTLRGSDRTFTFNEATPGSYVLRIEASNDDGRTVKTVPVTVTQSKPYAVSFPGSSLAYPAADRTTFVGRQVLLKPDIACFDRPVYSWSVDGVEQSGAHDAVFSFVPDAQGTYRIAVTVSEGTAEPARKLSRNLSRAAASVTAEVNVRCQSVSEADRMRPRTSASTHTADKVFEYMPAPGQFIGDTGAFGGFDGSETSQAAADAFAMRQLKAGWTVSLGAFGGYVTVGFDHSVPNTGGFDFEIEGNAYLTADGGSNEPGVVWVMQDVNGNGLPDDQWYELRGSESGKPSTVQDYQVTYYRPSAPEMPVLWTDNFGHTGQIDYLGRFHSQPYYYPQWQSASSYTLRGTRLAPNNTLNTATGVWSTKAFEWGYADNMGSDVVAGTGVNGKPQRVAFKISNAVDIQGRPVKLQYIDFVRVQSAVQAKCIPIGEVSTEISGVYEK